MSKRGGSVSYHRRRESTDASSILASAPHSMRPSFSLGSQQPIQPVTYEPGPGAPPITGRNIVSTGDDRSPSITDIEYDARRRSSSGTSAVYDYNSISSSRRASYSQSSGTFYNSARSSQDNQSTGVAPSSPERPPQLPSPVPSSVRPAAIITERRPSLGSSSAGVQLPSAPMSRSSDSQICYGRHCTYRGQNVQADGEGQNTPLETEGGLSRCNVPGCTYYCDCYRCCNYPPPPRPNHYYPSNPQNAIPITPITQPSSRRTSVSDHSTSGQTHRPNPYPPSRRGSGSN